MKRERVNSKRLDMDSILEDVERSRTESPIGDYMEDPFDSGLDPRFPGFIVCRDRSKTPPEVVRLKPTNKNLNYSTGVSGEGGGDSGNT